jgi:hypothetical protein
MSHHLLRTKIASMLPALANETFWRCCALPPRCNDARPPPNRPLGLQAVDLVYEFLGPSRQRLPDRLSLQREPASGLSVCKTFDRKKGWPIRVGGETEMFTFALDSGFVGFNYKLTKQDNTIIRSVATELWKRAKGDADGKVLKLTDAADILLRDKY